MTDNEILQAAKTARDNCLTQMASEAHKGQNRLVAIVCEHSRRFEKRMTGVANYKPGGFIDHMRRELLSAELGPKINAAVRYL